MEVDETINERDDDVDDDHNKEDDNGEEDVDFVKHSTSGVIINRKHRQGRPVFLVNNNNKKT